MPDLRDFTHLKPVRRGGKTLLYGATTADGPWFRLSKREAAFVTAHADRIIPKPETDNGQA